MLAETEDRGQTPRMHRHELARDQRSVLAIEGAPLGMVTAELVDRFDVRVRLLPVTDDSLRTKLRLSGGEVGFQEYFVKLRHDVPVEQVRF